MMTRKTAPRTARKTATFATVLAFVLASCSGTSTTKESVPNDTQAPGTYQVRLETSKGPVVIDVNRSWAPRGADRFYTLAKRGFYDQARFFRVVPGFVVQFGMHANPDENAKWMGANLMDDPVQQPNVKGTVSFASAGPNSRSTQLFINLGNNSESLDPQGFAVLGRVSQGLDIVEKINPEYGQTPDQEQITRRGNAYLLENFPKLDFIQKVTVTP